MFFTYKKSLIHFTFFLSLFMEKFIKTIRQFYSSIVFLVPPQAVTSSHGKTWIMNLNRTISKSMSVVNEWLEGSNNHGCVCLSIATTLTFSCVQLKNEKRKTNTLWGVFEQLQCTRMEKILFGWIEMNPFEVLECNPNTH